MSQILSTEREVQWANTLLETLPQNPNYVEIQQGEIHKDGDNWRQGLEAESFEMPNSPFTSYLVTDADGTATIHFYWIFGQELADFAVEHHDHKNRYGYYLATASLARYNGVTRNLEQRARQHDTRLLNVQRHLVSRTPTSQLDRPYLTMVEQFEGRLPLIASTTFVGSKPVPVKIMHSIENGINMWLRKMKHLKEEEEEVVIQSAIGRNHKVNFETALYLKHVLQRDEDCDLDLSPQYLCGAMGLSFIGELVEKIAAGHYTTLSSLASSIPTPS